MIEDEIIVGDICQFFSSQAYSEEQPSLKILLIFACPVGSKSLRLQNEERTIRESIKNSSTSARSIQLEVLPACTVDDLSHHLLQNKNCYDVIHFSGHADRTSILVKSMYSRIIEQNGQVDESATLSVLRDLEKVAEGVIGTMESEYQSQKSCLDPADEPNPFTAHFMNSSSFSPRPSPPVDSGDDSALPAASDCDFKILQSIEGTDAPSFRHHRRLSKQFKFEIAQLALRLKSGEHRSVDVAHDFSRRDLIELGVGSLVFESPKGAMYVPPRAFANLLSQYQADSLQCVVLNACGSRIQAEILQETSPLTVCFDGRISDEQSVNFSRGFYAALAMGLDFQEAYREGRTRMELYSLSTVARISGLNPNAGPTSTTHVDLDGRKRSVSAALFGGDHSVVNLVVNKELLESKRLDRAVAIKPPLSTATASTIALKLQVDLLQVQLRTLQASHAAVVQDNVQLKSMINYGISLLRQKDDDIEALKQHIAFLFPAALTEDAPAKEGTSNGSKLNRRQKMLFQQTANNGESNESPHNGSPKKVSRKGTGITGTSRPRPLHRTVSSSSPGGLLGREVKRKKLSGGGGKKVAFGLTTPSTPVVVTGSSVPPTHKQVSAQYSSVAAAAAHYARQNMHSPDLNSTHSHDQTQQSVDSVRRSVPGVALRRSLSNNSGGSDSDSQKSLLRPYSEGQLLRQSLPRSSLSSSRSTSMSPSQPNLWSSTGTSVGTLSPPAHSSDPVTDISTTGIAGRSTSLPLRSGSVPAARQEEYSPLMRRSSVKSRGLFTGVAVATNISSFDSVALESMEAEQEDLKLYVPTEKPPPAQPLSSAASPLLRGASQFRSKSLDSHPHFHSSHSVTSGTRQESRLDLFTVTSVDSPVEGSASSSPLRWRASYQSIASNSTMSASEARVVELEEDGCVNSEPCSSVHTFDQSVDTLSETLAAPPVKPRFSILHPEPLMMARAKQQLRHVVRRTSNSHQNLFSHIHVSTDLLPSSTQSQHVPPHQLPLQPLYNYASSTSRRPSSSTISSAYSQPSSRRLSETSQNYSQAQYVVVSELERQRLQVKEQFSSTVLTNIKSKYGADIMSFKLKPVLPKNTTTRVLRRSPTQSPSAPASASAPAGFPSFYSDDRDENSEHINSSGVSAVEQDISEVASYSQPYDKKIAPSQPPSVMVVHNGVESDVKSVHSDSARGAKTSPKKTPTKSQPFLSSPAKAHTQNGGHEATGHMVAQKYRFKPPPPPKRSNLTTNAPDNSHWLTMPPPPPPPPRAVASASLKEFIKERRELVAKSKKSSAFASNVPRFETASLTAPPGSGSDVAK